jgi:tetratricopeptide (TPR) repeat protein
MVYTYAVLMACNNTTTTKHQSPEAELVNGITQQINEDPQNATLYFKRAKAYLKLKNDSTACKDFIKASTLDSSKAEYFSAAGDLLFNSGDITSSVQYLQHAIQLNPNDARAKLKVAKLFLYIKEYQKSFTLINEVLRKDAYNQEAYFLKGMIYKDIQDTVNAISSFQTASQLNPDDAVPLMQLGNLHKYKQASKAIQYYTNAFKLDSTNPEPINAIGVMYQEQNQLEKAKQEFKRCIVINKNYAKGFYNLGCVYMDQDSLQQAINKFNIALQVEPTYAEAYYNKGLCYELLKDVANAIDNYKTALKMDPEFTLAKQAVARLQ